MIQGFSGGLLNRELIYQTDLPSFQRDFASLKTLNHGTGPDISTTSFRGSSATYFDADGVLQTAGTNVPRFDHNPSTGASLGLLIEESRTNQCTNSEASGAIGATGPTGWVVDATGALGLTRTITTGTINGMAYMDVRFNGTTTSSGNMRFDPRPNAGATAASGQAWTASAYLALQAGSIPAGAQMKVIARGRNSSDVATEDVQTNITLTSSLVRYAATATFSNANTARVTHDIRLDSVPNATAVDFTLRIAAPQLEQGAFPTSYIPTTTAAATRAADSAVVTPISSFYNQAEGTLFAEWRMPVATPSGQTRTALSIGDGSDANVARFLANSSEIRTSVRNANTAIVTIDAAAAAAGTQYRQIIALRTDDYAATVNGASASTDTSGTLPSNFTTMRLGEANIGGGSGLLNGHIRKVAYWPKRLTNTLLQQLTT